MNLLDRFTVRPPTAIRKGGWQRHKSDY